MRIAPEKAIQMHLVTEVNWVVICGSFQIRCLTLLYSVFLSTEAEELYQKRVLTITGICVALLVVGIVCVVAYCKTK